MGCPAGPRPGWKRRQEHICQAAPMPTINGVLSQAETRCSDMGCRQLYMGSTTHAAAPPPPAGCRPWRYTYSKSPDRAACVMPAMRRWIVNLLCVFFVLMSPSMGHMTSQPHGRVTTANATIEGAASGPLVTLTVADTPPPVTSKRPTRPLSDFVALAQQRPGDKARDTTVAFTAEVRRCQGRDGGHADNLPNPVVCQSNRQCPSC